MAGFGMNFSQNQQMTQQMHLSPQMLQSLEFLMMNHLDLVEALRDEIQKNPALEITRFPSEDVARVAQKKKAQNQEDFPLYKKSADSSDLFQQFLENQQAPSVNIQECLLKQFRLTTNDETTLALGERLITFVDAQGFIQVSPLSILNPHNPRETRRLLEKTLATIQTLDPVGCCTSGPQESVYVQARYLFENRDEPLGKDGKNLALFLLAGNLSLLEKMKIPTILKKLKEKQEEFASAKTIPVPQSTSSWTLPPKIPPLPQKITDRLVEQAVQCIKQLDPLPARNFSSAQGMYICPEVTVEKILDGDDWKFKVCVNNNLLPEIRISPSYEHIDEKSRNLSKDEKKIIKAALKEGQGVLQALAFRKNTLENAVKTIVELQEDFFLHGPSHLRPLKMRDVAQRIQVHETTISRLANNKYLRCQWGIFEIRFFFSNEVHAIAPTRQHHPRLPHQHEAKGSAEKFSKEGVKAILKELLEQHRTASPEGKPLSDQKLSDLLAQRGIKVARRTVAKYRGELNIDSSFDRK